MSRAITADMSVFTIDGTSYLATIDGVTYDHDIDTVEGRSVNSAASFQDAVKRRSMISTGVMTNVATTSGSPRVSNLDASAFTIGTSSYLATLRSMDISGTNEFKEASGVSDAWALPIWSANSYSGNCRLSIPTAGFHAIMGIAHGSFTGLNLNIGVTINGVAMVFPVVIKGVKFDAQAGDIQYLDVRFEERGTVTSGPATTSLLGVAISAPGTALPVVLTTRASNGMTFSGNFRVSQWGFSIQDGAIIKTNYDFISTGTVTAS